MVHRNNDDQNYSLEQTASIGQIFNAPGLTLRVYNSLIWSIKNSSPPLYQNFYLQIAWIISCIILVVDVVWCSAIHLSVEGTSLAIIAIVAFVIMSILYANRSIAISDIAAATAVLGVVTSTSTVLTYLAASCQFPLQDALFQQIDSTVGFEWLWWRDLTVNRHALYVLMLVAYVSMQPQVALAILYFPLIGKSERLVELAFLFIVTIVITIAISVVWPALGPFAMYGDERGAYPFTDLLLMRAAGPWRFDLTAMQGIVSMPSYHTVMALLLTYIFRSTGVLGYCIAGLNVLMLLSIPAIGGHYLVDMFVGGALALGCIYVYRGLRSAPGDGSA